MNSELKPIWKTACLWTAVLCMICAAAAALIWPGKMLEYGLSAAAGALIGLAGLWMIIAQADSLSSDPASGKKKGAAGYAGRYVFYAVCLFFLTWCGLSPLAMLAGILCSKASLVIYALLHRKDNE
ncbi:MAG: ATP synthase subunit I [Erysipelotrichaceae bacterium]|nr:ATP synthase subunit I [Erysipelotrichaceae bacterium]